MVEVEHRVKVFVYRFTARDLLYLIARPRPRIENLWGPLVGPIAHGEDPETAVLRRVREETGLARPAALVDLRAYDRLRIGDFALVDWVYGYQVAASSRSGIAVASDSSELRWEDFARAYRRIGSEADRRAMLRLHLSLGAA